VTNRPLRPLAIFVVLAGGDYLLWNWSLNGNHDIIALVAGVTLMPLVIAILWLLVVGAARMLADATQRPRAGYGEARRARSSGARRQAAKPATSHRAPRSASPAQRNQHAHGVAGADNASPTASPSSKLAA
jgi:predicted lipid-binding transport protein (Tim44 family)